MNWRNLFWAECRKLRRLKMIWIAVAAAFLTAGIVLAGGMEVYRVAGGALWDEGDARWEAVS